MSSETPDRPSPEDRRFEEALRGWAGRPLRTPPAEAARRIAERLPERRAARGPVLRAVALLAAAVFVLAVGLALYLGPLAPGRSPEPPSAGAAPPAGVPVAPAGDVLVLELDAETTLYMTLHEGDPS